ncbi:oligosaccharide repeat unit polymerase family protein [Methanocaldococcus sp.]
MIELNHLFLILCCIYLIFSDISLYSSLVFLFSAIFFYISFLVGKRLYFRIFNENNINEGINNFNKKNKSIWLYIGLFFVFIGLISILADIIWINDIPLFNPIVRYHLNVYFTTLSHLIFIGWALILSYYNIEKKRVKKVILYTLILSIPIALLGYRTNVLVLLLSTIAVLYYKNLIETKDIIKYFGIIFILLVIMSILRMYFLGAGGNPILSRIELTMSVYDILFNHFNGVLDGYLHYAAIFSYFGMCNGPRTVIANILGIYGVSITPTIVGSVVADFGTLSIIPYFGFLGIYLGYLYMLAKHKGGVYLGIYGVVFAYTLIAVESGILDLDVIIYYVFGVLLCIYATLKRFLKR